MDTRDYSQTRTDFDTDVDREEQRSEGDAENDRNLKDKADKSRMTKSEAGKKGGNKTAELYGSGHFRRIGREGGKARGKRAA